MTQLRPGKADAVSHLRILSTTDLHMHMTSFDYYAGKPDPTVGLTRTASLIARARAEADETGTLTLLFDNGDALQGAPMGDLARDNPERAHPLMRAFEHLHYDAIGLGNHDFDLGLSALDTVLRQSSCPVLCSNMTKRASTKDLAFTQFAILDRIVQADGCDWPLKIGVLSFLPPQTMNWAASQLEGQVRIDDILASARAIVPDLKTAGCDLVIALCHSGLSALPDQPDLENAAVPLAAVDGIDAVIAGHCHTLLPGPHYQGLPHVDAQNGKVHGKPMVMAGVAGSHLGQIDLTLHRDSDGHWHVSDSRASLRPIVGRQPDGTAMALVPEDPDLVALLAEDHSDTLDLMNQPAGHSPLPLHSYFTFIAQDRALAVVAAAQAAALRPHLAKSMLADLPLLSAVSPGKFGARSGPGNFTDVPAGPLSLRHLADLSIFPNDLRALMISGTQVIDWLEMSASLFHQIEPGAEDAVLIDPDVPGYEFDVLHGLTYVIDLSKPARFHHDGTLRGKHNRRTSDVSYKGFLIRDDQLFVVALNSFRAKGGGHPAALHDAQPIPLPPLSIRNALRDYLSGKLPVDPLEKGPPPWRFAPMPGTSVSIQTGPGAAKHMQEVAARGVENHGIDATGFLQLSVPL